MIIGLECHSILSDPVYMQESMNYECARVEYEDSTRILIQFFHEGFRVCNEMLDTYSNEYDMYAEAGVGDFLKNLATKVKEIIKKIFDWLVNVVKIIGKIILAPFGVIFRKSSSNNSGGGGSSTSDSTTAGKPSDKSVGTERNFGNAGSVMGILSGISDDFEFKYIKDTGFSNIFNPVDIIDEIIKAAENKTLLDSLKDKTIVKEYTDATVEAGGVDKVAMIDGLKDRYKTVSDDILRFIKYFGNSVYTINKSNRSKSNSFFDAVKKIFSIGIGTDYISPDAILDKILKNKDLKKELLILSKYENQSVDYAKEILCDTNKTKSNATMVQSNIEHKQKLLNQLLTGNTQIKSKTESILKEFLQTYEFMPSSTDEEKKLKLEKTKGISDLLRKLQSATTDDSVVVVLKSALEIMKTELTPAAAARPAAMRMGGKNKLAADSTFSTVVKTGDTKEFKILDNSFNIFDYNVKIGSVKYIDIIINDGSMFDKAISEQATAIYDTLSTIVADFNTLKQTNDKYTDTANKTTTVAKVGVDTATSNSGNGGAEITKSAAFDSVVVEMVKSTLNSLKEDITRLINETNDIERHSRLVYLSIFQASVAKEAFDLQQHFIQENVLAKAMYEISGELANKKSKVANEDDADSKKKHAALTGKETQLAAIEEMRKALYSNVRKTLYGE